MIYCRLQLNSLCYGFSTSRLDSPVLARTTVGVGLLTTTGENSRCVGWNRSFKIHLVLSSLGINRPSQAVPYSWYLVASTLLCGDDTNTRYRGGHPFLRCLLPRSGPVYVSVQACLSASFLEIRRILWQSTLTERGSPVKMCGI